MKVNVFHHDGGTHVARITTTETTLDDALERAWRLIQNIGGSWSRGPKLIDGSPNGDFSPEIEVVAPLIVRDGQTFGLRSSMVGDVFEIDGGDRYRVEGFGFAKIVRENAQ